MGAKSVAELTPAEKLNFLLTNRLPRRWLTLFMGRFSKIENPLVRTLSIRIWQMFVDDLRLHEAKKTQFSSLHDCFIRELKPDARVIDQNAAVLTSPCDAVVGEHGRVSSGRVLQAKGFPYSVGELLGNPAAAEALEGARFVTLRLKSSMYHRFHAPCDGRITGLRYISGDTWNVNPIALKKVERLFCRNERLILALEGSRSDTPTMIVAVAAILVASMRIHGLDERLNLEYAGANEIPFEREVRKGDELGYFEHGSTIVMFADARWSLADQVSRGNIIRMGQPLLRRRVGDELQA
ncbi:MAG: archaetidylserine decarboxylase [Pseudomonadota bacterium]